MVVGANQTVYDEVTAEMFTRVTYFNGTADSEPGLLIWDDVNRNTSIKCKLLFTPRAHPAVG